MLKILLQLILIVIFVSALGIGLYFAIPWLYRETIVPVQNNTADIEALSRRVDQAETQLNQRTEALQARNADLEGELAGLQEASAVQDRTLATAAAELATLMPAVEDLYGTTDAQTEDLAKIELSVARALKALTDQQQALDDQASALGDFQDASTTQVEALAAQSADLAAREATLEGRLALLQAAQDLVYVQFLLQDDNIGAARDTLAMASAHLVHAAGLSPELQDAAIDWVARIGELDTLIEERSFRASPTLAALWADVADRALPPLPEGVSALTTLSPSTVQTTTVTGTVAITSTLVTTPTLTVTPTPTPPPPTPTPTPAP